MPSGHDCRQMGRLLLGRPRLPGLQSAIPLKALLLVADQLLPPHLRAQRRPQLQACCCQMLGVCITSSTCLRMSSWQTLQQQAWEFDCWSKRACMCSSNTNAANPLIGGGGVRELLATCRDRKPAPGACHV